MGSGFLTSKPLLTALGIAALAAWGVTAAVKAPVSRWGQSTKARTQLATQGGYGGDSAALPVQQQGSRLASGVGGEGSVVGTWVCGDSGNQITLTFRGGATSGLLEGHSTKAGVFGPSSDMTYESYVVENGTIKTGNSPEAAHAAGGGMTILKLTSSQLNLDVDGTVLQFTRAN